MKRTGSVPRLAFWHHERAAGLVGLAIVLLALSGCGDDGGQSDETGPNNAARDAGDDSTTDAGEEPDTPEDTSAPDADPSDAAPDALVDADEEDADEDADDEGDADDASDVADTPDIPTTSPQLIASEPVHGEVLAPRTPFVTLRFDRPMPLENLEGAVFSTREGLPTRTPMQPMACPDTPADASCVRVAFAPSFVADGALASGLYHTVILDRGLADAHGNTIDEETVVSFATQGEFLAVNDAEMANFETTGLAYDPRTRSLFYSMYDALLNLENPSGPVVVRRVQSVGAGQGAPTTFAQIPVGPGSSPYLSELNVTDGRLYVAGPYASTVWVFDDPAAADGAVPDRAITGTGLPDPDASLLQVSSLVAANNGTRFFFGFGNILATARPTAVAQLNNGVWSLFGQGEFSNAETFVVAGRDDAAPGVVYVAGEDGIVKLSDGGTRLNAQNHQSRAQQQLWVDSVGRLYHLNSQGGPLVIFDTSGSNGFSTVASLDNQARGRFAVHERGNVLTIYMMAYRSLGAAIYGQRLAFCDEPGPCVSSCDNEVLDGAEGDVDCGGTCDICQRGQTCNRDADCATGYCNNGVCGDIEIGCADGTREGFVDERSAPQIAGCSGGWSLPGLVGGESATPACDRAAGDDSDNPDGEGCRAADLCAEGWRVCASPEEVRRGAPGGSCEGVTQEGDPQRFFATAVQSGGSGECVPGAPDHANDLFGCGNYGAPTPGAASCGPLNLFSGDRCVALITLPIVWQCGDDGFREGMMVTKPSPEAGGVLCCKCDRPGCDGP